MGDVTPIANRRERRYWDRYVAEAREVYSEIVLADAVPDDGSGNGRPADIIRVHVPTVQAINDLNQAEQSGDLWKQVEVLLGADTPRFKAVADGAPATALLNLIQGVVADLGLSASPGNAPASSA